jgi:hypothetical protein
MKKRKWNTRKQKKSRGGENNAVNTYKNLLSSFVYSDAKHDFGDIYDKYKGDIKDSIPNAP